MRRSLSVFVILIFGLGPLATFLQSDDEARLPACCRRHGAHHCAMSEEMAFMMVAADSGSTRRLSAPAHCPYFPRAVAANTASVHAQLASPLSLPELLTRPHSPAATRASARLSQLRTRSDRGPPASFHS